jgi:predicted nucleotidyltransferase
MREFSVEALGNALQQHNKIDFALLFGSSQDSVLVRDTADIDIAVHLSERPTPDMLAEIVGLCQDALLYDNIDIVVLNTSDPILAFEALSGRRLACRNEEAYLSFFSLTCRQYEDEMLRIERSLSYRRAAKEPPMIRI